MIFFVGKTMPLLPVVSQSQKNPMNHWILIDINGIIPLSPSHPHPAQESQELRWLVARRHHLPHQAPRVLLPSTGRHRFFVERWAQREAAKADVLQDLKCC